MRDYEKVPPVDLDIVSIAPSGFSVSDGTVLLALTLKDESVMIVE
jgi:hypothetical protein